MLIIVDIVQNLEYNLVKQYKKDAIIMTFTEKFQSLKTAFDKANTKKFNADFAVQITMTDEDCGGTFYIEYKEGNYSVEPYDYYDNNAYINASAASVAKLSKGVVAKDLAIGGDQSVVTLLASALKPAKTAAKKAPAKKPAVKKEAVKKTAKKVEPKKEAAKPAVKKETKPAAKKAEPKTEKKEVKAPAKKAVKTAVKKDTKTTK